MLAYGAESSAIKDGRIAVTQSISGTGALRIGGEFLARFYENKTIYVPTPTWSPPNGEINSPSRANHLGIFNDSGLQVKLYRYYDKKNISLDLDGMIEDIKILTLIYSI